MLLFSALKPDTDDLLGLRRQAVFRRLLYIIIPLIIVIGPLVALTTRRLQLLLLIVSCVLVGFFSLLYTINQRGYVYLAVNLFLFGLTIIILAVALIDKTLSPELYLLTIIIVVSAAFGTPISPLRWALGFSLLPFLMHFIITGDPIAQNRIFRLETGVANGSIFSQQLAMILLYWVTGGAAYLTASLLHQALKNSQTVAQIALNAQQDLQKQQGILSEKNSELEATQHNLEELVAALSVPVIPVAERIGLLALVGPIDRKRMIDVERTTLEICFQRRLQALVIDISGSTTIRQDSVQALVQLVNALRLIGVQAVIAGISSQNARLITQHTHSFPHSVATVQEALAGLQLETRRISS